MTLLIHPGFHKTGTTWLQEELFTHSPQFHSVLGQYEIDDLLVSPHDFLFEATHATEAILRRSLNKPGVVDVLTSELLVGNPLFGSRDAMTLAERLRSAVPDGKILLTTREQSSMIRSLYQQYLKRGGTQKLASFVNPRLEPGYFAFHPEILRLDRYATLYERLFGPGNVMVLPHELLARRPEEFVSRIIGFATGSAPPAPWMPEPNKVGRSPPAGATDLIRFANRLRRSVLNPGAPRPGRRLGEVLFRAAYRYPFSSAAQLREWSRAVEPLRDMYREGNRDLQRFCPVSLEALGYSMPGECA